MNEYPVIKLKKGREEAVRRRHHWVFSGAVQAVEGNPENGDLVKVTDSSGDFLAIGHYQKGSILVRIITFRDEQIDPAFWKRKITSAYSLRQKLGLTENAETNAYRLINGEGDGLPGLIIDVYDSSAILQAHSFGMDRSKKEIAVALKDIIGINLRTIYDKSKELPKEVSGQNNNEFLLGNDHSGFIREYGHNFFVDWQKGQKTGFFLDQRENRKLLASYSKGKTVLNAFCYSGGFSIYALAAGAAHVDSVDASQKAIDWTGQNVELNSAEGTHRLFCADVITFLNNNEKLYDIVVLDPPAFAKRQSARHKAVQGYKRLNNIGIQSVKPGGLLFTFSCSQAVDRQLFKNTIVAAALETGRRCRILHEMIQPADHPVSLYHPEGAYLKGLVLYLE